MDRAGHPPDRLDADPDRDRSEDQGLGEGDEVLGLGVSVVVIGVRRFGGEAHPQEDQTERDHVDDRIQSLGEDRQASGREPHPCLGQREQDRDEDRDQGGALGGGPGVGHRGSVGRER